MYCFAEQVPTTDTNEFQGIPDDATLHVPASALDAYKNASGWRTFGNIVALTDEEITPVKEIHRDDAAVSIKEVFDLQGRRINKSVRGMNVLRMSNGTTRKVLMK